MKARIVIAVIVIPCFGVWAIFDLILWKAIDIVSLPVGKWMRRGRYRDDIGDNYKKHWGRWE